MLGCMQPNWRASYPLSLEPVMNNNKQKLRAHPIITTVEDNNAEDLPGNSWLFVGVATMAIGL